MSALAASSICLSLNVMLLAVDMRLLRRLVVSEFGELLLLCDKSGIVLFVSSRCVECCRSCSSLCCVAGERDIMQLLARLGEEKRTVC